MQKNRIIGEGSTYALILEAVLLVSHGQAVLKHFLFTEEQVTDSKSKMVYFYTTSFLVALSKPPPPPHNCQPLPPKYHHPPLLIGAIPLTGSILHILLPHHLHHHHCLCHYLYDYSELQSRSIIQSFSPECNLSSKLCRTLIPAAELLSKLNFLFSDYSDSCKIKSDNFSIKLSDWKEPTTKKWAINNCWQIQMQTCFFSDLCHSLLHWKKQRKCRKGGVSYW